MASFLGIGITIGSFFYALFFLWTLGRPRPLRPVTPQEMAILHRKYAKYKKVDSLTALFIGLPLAGLAAWGFVDAMSSLSYWYWRPEGTVLAKTMNPGIWVLPAIFYAIPIVLAHGALFWQLWFRHDFDEWMAYGALTTGVDHRRLLRLLCVVSLIPAALITLGSLNTSARVTPQSLFVRSLTSFGERQHTFVDITEIHKTPLFIPAVGREILNYTVRFKDGTAWSTQGWLKDTDPTVLESDQRFVEYISRQSRVPIQ